MNIGNSREGRRRRRTRTRTRIRKYILRMGLSIFFLSNNITFKILL